MPRFLALLASLALAPCTTPAVAGGPPSPAPDPAPPPAVVELGDQRCQALAPAAIEQARRWGYTIDCTPSIAPPPAPAYGWTDHTHLTVWLWPDGKNDKGVRATLWHELGHVHQAVTGYTGADREADATMYAACHLTPDERNGTSIPTRPADCSPWSP